MGLGVSLITVSPNTTIKSSDANSNWQSLNNATQFTGNITINTSMTIQLGAAIYFPSGQLGGMNYFSGPGTGTYNHGIKGTPHSIQINYAGNFGSPPTQAAYWYNATSTTVQVVSQPGYSWIALAYLY